MNMQGGSRLGGRSLGTLLPWVGGIIIGLVGAFVGQTMFHGGGQGGGDLGQKTIEEQNLAEIRKVYDVLSKSYAGSGHVSLSGMWEGGVKGFVESLRDPYTEYLPAEKNTSFTESLKGEDSFEGIGAALKKKDDTVVIQEVFKGTPAALGGLQPLDVIVDVDGVKVGTMDIGDVVKKIRGPKGSDVTLTVYRAREKNPEKRILTVTLQRATVDIPSVSSTIIPLTGSQQAIGILEISIIGEETENILKKEIDAMKGGLSGQKLAGVLVDLRGNGGGFLPKAVEIASHFLPKGAKVVSTHYTLYPNEQYLSKGYAEFADLPVVVLVDGLTASAGEIIAGALAQSKQAKLVGTKTFGKGSIQTVVDIGSGTALKYTIGKWYLPDGSNIDHEGITPDIVVEFDKDAYQDGRDVQREAALKQLRSLIQQK